MSQKRSYKQYPKEFKTETVVLVLEQGYSVPYAAKSLGIAANILYRWKELHEQQITGKSFVEDDRDRFILSPNCGLAHRKTYDDRLDSSIYCQGGKFETAQTGTRVPQ